jgi:hypothetical protein
MTGILHMLLRVCAYDHAFRSTNGAARVIHTAKRNKDSGQDLAGEENHRALKQKVRIIDSVQNARGVHAIAARICFAWEYRRRLTTWRLTYYSSISYVSLCDMSFVWGDKGR